MERDLGQMGESTFQLWCSNVGLTSNPSTNDRYGWDYVVEFPSGTAGTIPLDRRPTPLECKVQVKATDGMTKKVQVKLSNIHRLVQYSGPAFMCFIEFDGGSQPINSYLKEIDKEIIKKTLLKLRKLDVKGDKKLHTKTLTVKFTKNDSFTPDGVGLKSKIEKLIGGNIDDYIRKKASYRETVGYEAGNKEGSFTLSGEKALSDIVDLSIGLKDHVEVSDFQVHDVRFGIRSKTPELVLDTGKISIADAANGGSRTLTFLWPGSNKKYSFDVDLYAPVMFAGQLPLNKLKMRMVSPLFEVVFEFENKSANFTFNILTEENVQISLVNLYEFSNVLNLLQDGDKENPVLLLDNSDDFNLELSGRDIGGGLISQPVINLINKTWEIAKRFHVQKNISVNLSDLVENSEEISDFYQAVIDESTVNLKAKIEKYDKSIDLHGEKDAVVVAPRFVTFGGRVFSSVVRYEGIISSDGVTIHGECLVNKRHMELLFDEDDENIDNEINAIAEKLKVDIPEGVLSMFLT